MTREAPFETNFKDPIFYPEPAKYRVQRFKLEKKVKVYSVGHRTPEDEDRMSCWAEIP